MTRKRIFEIVEISKGSKISKLYDYTILVAIFISVIPLMIRKQYSIFSYIEIITCTLFIIDYILRWITADYRQKREGWVPFVIYPFTIGAIFDLLSILPCISYLNPSLKIFRVYRLFRIFRVAKIFRYYEPLQVMLSVLRRERYFLMTVLGFAIFYIVITAMFMFNVEQVNPETGDYLFENFFDALYWATCTLTTVGYGDLYPTSDWGRIISMISALMGIAIIALPSGIITAGYMEETRQRKEKKYLEKGTKTSNDEI
mgnify:CR=1 FL=1